MKKLNVRIIFCILTVVACMTCSVAFAEDEVAEFVNYDDVANEVKIIHPEGLQPKGSKRLLYNGDIIMGDTQKFSITCKEYARVVNLDSNACIIIYEPPSGASQISNVVLKSLGPFCSAPKNVEGFVYGGTRGPASSAAGSSLKKAAQSLTPRPGWNVTLLKNQEVNFAWKNANHETFAIIDGKGNKIYEKNIKNLNGLSIVPADIKLEANVPYSWGYDGEYTGFKFKVLDSQTETEVTAKLAELDKMKLTDEERVSRKALLVQLISDSFPDKVNLYWLSSQWLGEFDNLGTNEKQAQYLLQRCKKHLDQEMNQNQ